MLKFTMSFLLLLAGCSPLLRDPLGCEVPEAPYVQMAEKIMWTSGTRIALKHGMYLHGTVGQLMFCVEMIGVSFEIYEPLTKERARELIVDCTQEFVKDINAHKEIQPYLVTRPFTYKNVEIKIFSLDQHGRDVYDPFIEIVANRQGKIKYASQAPGKELSYENVYIETFEEALEKLKHQSQ